MDLPPIPFIGIFCSPLSVFSCVYVLIVSVNLDKWTNAPVVSLTQVKELMASQPRADGRTLPLVHLSFISCGYYPTSICFNFHHNSKSPSHQGYGFSHSHVWMWELDCKDSWVPKNWCFWTVVLENTLESPLDCKKIQSVHPKGDQSWVFNGRTDVEAETPILWPPDVKSWLIGEDPDAGKDWGQEEKEMTEDEMVGWHHWLNGHEFE